MIELYSGTPGSGKSLHVADLMQRWIHNFKSPAICNFAFKANYCKPRGNGGVLFVNNWELNPELLIWFSEEYKKHMKVSNLKEDSILLVIDECQLIFNAREWNDRCRKDWISFFTQHRKLGYRVILIAQFCEMIDKQIRAVIEYEYIHRKVGNIGIGGKLLSFALGGKLHVAVKMYKPLKQKVGSDFFKSDKNLYRLYDTYNRFTG